MRLNVTALAVAAGVLWGAVILITAVAHAIWPPYGGAFLEMAASLYPGYEASAGVGPVIVGTLYGLVDGAIFGAILAWLYNLAADRSQSA
jgi:ABC-type phosphate transport system permease subunit